MRKISVIVPAYNEEKTINEILERIFAVDIDKEVIVVDDGSVDATPEILKSLKHSQMKVYIKQKNEGKGAAIRYGISKAAGEYMIIQDSDLEYDPDDYKCLLEPLMSGDADVVYGDRFPLGRKNMFFKQWVANKFLTIITNCLYGGNIADMETCYKVIPLNIIKELDLREENFDIEAEISSKLLKKKFKIKNIPINYKGRSYSEGKKIGFKDFLRAIRILIKYKFSE